MAMYEGRVSSSATEADRDYERPHQNEDAVMLWCIPTTARLEKPET